VATDILTATLIGGQTLLVEIGGFRFLTDPTFRGVNLWIVQCAFAIQRASR
jgi:L-ascorbate metabolism protein UlaG (beta-lactamase superfamily)